MVAQTTQLLAEQLDVLDRHARLERHPGAPDASPFTNGLEDLIALALETIERIRKHCAYYNRVASTTGPASGTQREILISYWLRWRDIASQVLERVVASEAKGVRPEYADELRFALNEADLTANDDKILDAIKRMDGGQGTPLDQVLNELSRQP